MSFIIFNKHSYSNPLAISLLLSPNEYYSYEAYQYYATTMSPGLTWSLLRTTCLDLFPDMSLTDVSTLMENIDLLDSTNHLSVMMDVQPTWLHECVTMFKSVYENSFLIPDSILEKFCTILMHLQKLT